MPRPETPLLAADIIIEVRDQPGTVVLVKRKFAPFGWAIPGGFVEIGETVEHAAIREMKEEVGLDVIITGLLGVYSDPKRDPRGHTVTIIYTGVAEGQPVAADDAADVGIFAENNLPQLLAFDHRQVLADYFSSRQN